MALRLAKAGWLGGDPKKILATDADIVLNMLHYEFFESDYSKECDILNKQEDRRR